MKTKRIISLIAAALALVLALTSCGAGGSKPEDTTAKPADTAAAPADTTEKPAETSEIPEDTSEPVDEPPVPAVKALYEALKESGSVEIGLSALPAALVGDSVEVNNIKAKIYYDEGMGALELGAQISGKTYDLIATGSEDEITLRTGLLENAYGINFSDAKKNISENEFISGLLGEMFGSEETEDGETKLAVDDIIDSIKKGIDSSKQFGKFAESYGEKIKNIVNNVCEINESAEDGGSVVNFTVKVEDVTEILKQLYGEFRNDAELRSFIEENFGKVFETVDMPIDFLYSATDEDIQSFSDTYTEQFKGYRLEGEIHFSEDGFRTASFVVKDASGNDFAKIDISLEGDVKSASLEYDGVYYSISYETKADTEQEYNAVVNLTKKENNVTATVELCNISYNKETGAYTVIIYVEDTAIEIKGTLEVSPSLARFTVNSVKSGEEEVFSGEFYVVVKANDSMPEAAKGYTDILTLNEEGFSELYEKIMEQMPSFEPEEAPAEV